MLTYLAAVAIIGNGIPTYPDTNLQRSIKTPEDTIRTSIYFLPLSFNTSIMFDIVHNNILAEQYIFIQK